MEITRENMDALYQTYNTAFSEAQKAAAERAFPNQLIVEDVALTLPVTGAATMHPWLEQIRGMREWIGDRVVNNLTLNSLTVTNRDFENTIAVSANAIEDDQYGAYTPLIGMLGDDAQRIWIRLVMAAITGNGLWADGNPFFAKGRVLGASTITNASTAALSRAAVEAAVAAMRGWTLHGGEPAEVSPRFLVVGPALEGTARQIIEADLVAETVGDGVVAVSNVSTARSLQLRVSDRLVGSHSAAWYVLGAKGGIPAVAVQQRKVGALTRKDRDTDDNVFHRNEYLYGTHARGEAFCTLPFLAYAGGLNSAPDWSAA